ncbi:glutathione peroxidase [Pseudomonas cichorii]|uniref:Glutathione peroxidase n=1 Tax=Pseudomonas lijiangensis TaxID=2995658 RepID=A0ABX8HPF0_9PSED|nr:MULTISPECIES: glutathione peroxidase [Pseudomonas syringae group]MBX8499938.1 glutathione peroxidase [Pseudomonas lijiangensis]MBX8503695.1 glutathione peroxidase [Pseudomonas lijiangensis]MBX8509718.1 glutathione peroxidase [Pseudomonas cichorii]MBX8524805.1 glutathione peroxidase [Pseudomonas cichorii]MBX8533425.1 glutathione peroxidase [Pseudomonas cichorii]
MKIRWISVPVLLLAMSGAALAADCPPLLQGELPKLRSKENIDLCQRFAGKPMVVVNTASFCGFAPQFKGLEALSQRYKAQGLEVLGVPSNDFKQESGDGEETAKVCYVNYGVTFTMTEPQPVRGDDATHLFKVLAEQSSAPRWNFYKYVVDRQGKVVASFSSMTKPDDPDLIAAIEKAIASKP